MLIDSYKHERGEKMKEILMENIKKFQEDGKQMKLILQNMKAATEGTRDNSKLNLKKHKTDPKHDRKKPKK